MAIALALSLNPVIAFAQAEAEAKETTITAEKTALITELRTLTFRDDNATQILDLMIKQIQDQAVSMGSGFLGEEADPAVTASINESVTRITNRMYELMNEKIDFVTLQREIDFKLYDEYFTEAELQDLIDFYKTATGRKTAEIFPELTQRSMELFSEQLTPAMLEITQQVIMEEFAFGMGDMGEFEEVENWDGELEEGENWESEDGSAPEELGDAEAEFTEDEALETDDPEMMDDENMETDDPEAMGDEEPESFQKSQQSLPSRDNGDVR